MIENSDKCKIYPPEGQRISQNDPNKHTKAILALIGLKIVGDIQSGVYMLQNKPQKRIGHDGLPLFLPITCLSRPPGIKWWPVLLLGQTARDLPELPETFLNLLEHSRNVHFSELRLSLNYLSAPTLFL